VKKITLDYESPIPLHHQVFNSLKRELKEGKIIDEEGKLPTEQELSKIFNVSRITIRTALRNLKNEGILNPVRGIGTFVNIHKVENWTGQLLGFTETLKRAGFIPSAKTIKIEKGKNSNSLVKENLSLESTWGIERLRFANNRAIALEKRYFPIEIGLMLEKEDLDKLQIYKYLEEEINIDLKVGKQTISAVNASDTLSSLLRIPKNTAVLYIQRLTLSDKYDRVEFSESYYRSDYFKYNVLLKR